MVPTLLRWNLKGTVLGKRTTLRETTRWRGLGSASKDSAKDDQETREGLKDRHREEPTYPVTAASDGTSWLVRVSCILSDFHLRAAHKKINHQTQPWALLCFNNEEVALNPAESRSSVSPRLHPSKGS